MKKMWKRFVSLLLACTLLAGMLPLSASAAVSAPTEDSQWITEKIEEINAGLEQGEQYHRGNYYKLGDSDLYRLTFTRTIDTETATITDAVIFIVPGTDANENNSSIPDYNSLGETPWEESSASAIYIADGVTGIGDHAFDGMTTLETIEFENSKSLTKVGEYAFNNCDKMVGLSLDLSNVTTLGKYAFNGCERLGSGENNKGVTLSDELTTIPENAFNTCGLKNVNIPTSCTEIGNNAFANNSLSQNPLAQTLSPAGAICKPLRWRMINRMVRNLSWVTAPLARMSLRRIPNRALLQMPQGPHIMVCWARLSTCPRIWSPHLEMAKIVLRAISLLWSMWILSSPPVQRTDIIYIGRPFREPFQGKGNQW